MDFTYEVANVVSTESEQKKVAVFAVVLVYFRVPEQARLSLITRREWIPADCGRGGQFLEKQIGRGIGGHG